MTLEAVLDEPGCCVRGDAKRLEQALGNLLSNAIKFTPAGGHVAVRVGVRHGMVEVSVRDDGEGIGSEFVPHVFDRFCQEDGSRTRRHGGLGLGLTLVRQIVEAHGGTVEADSEGKGRGTTVTVRLPQVGQAETIAIHLRPRRRKAGRASASAAGVSHVLLKSR